MLTLHGTHGIANVVELTMQVKRSRVDFAIQFTQKPEEQQNIASDFCLKIRIKP